MPRHPCNEHPQLEWVLQVAQLPADWDTDLPRDHFLRADSLAAHERARLPSLQSLYCALRIDHKIVAQAAFQLLQLQPEHLSPSALKPWQHRLWRLFTSGISPRLLVAGQLFRHDAEAFHTTACQAPFQRFQWYRQAMDDAMRRFGAHAVLVKEPPPDLVPYFQHYAPQYLLLRNDSSMQLNLPPAWHSFQDYEKSLKHKYAQRLRKVRQTWQGLEIRELNADEVSRESETIYQLYLQVSLNQPVRMGLLSRAFLPELKRFYQERLLVWGIYEAGKMIAFASAWVREERFDMFYIGFDYDRNTALQLYFNILFFSIEQAILRRKHLLILGRTALEAKARVGCRPSYLNTFLYIRNPLVRNLIGRLQQKLAEGGGEWENRHPFKPEQPDAPAASPE